jgi:general secretion pathway protein G
MIELMLVILIISILMAIAAPIYTKSVIRAKESVLKQDLFTLREQIDNYTLDKEKAPQSLEDLVTAGYLKIIPKDPMTGSTETWVPVTEDIAMSIDQTETGISDVHSGSNAIGTDGTQYSSW